jgi:linoleoyl-CoA desaturase
LKAKAVFTTAVLAVSYAVLVFVSAPWYVKTISAVLLVHALLATATGIMHDANHGAFSRSRRVNALLSYSADFLGASSWLWRKNHNVAHHHWTNVEGRDLDIELQPFARLSPSQPRLGVHRYQHVYLWPLYGFLTLKWFCFGDFQSWWRDREQLRSRDRAFYSRSITMFAGKFLHLTWALVVPMLYHSWWHVLLVYAACSWALGFALAVVFQLAHCVDKAEFCSETRPLKGIDSVLHQLATTVDFESRSWLGRLYGAWLLGGLEYQVEHHLAPRLPHTVYRGFARSLESLCAEQGWHRRTHGSLLRGLASHTRHLRRMGRLESAPFTSHL